MRPSFAILFIFIASFAFSQSHRIVSLNGAITEIVASLGKANDIVGVDVTSTFPKGLKASDLGHVRSISVEAILQLKPTMVLATDRDNNQEVFTKLRAAKIPVHIIAQEFSAQGTKKLIREVGQLIGVKSTGKLEKKIDDELRTLKKIDKAPTVLFIYARGAGTLMVAGNETPVAKMIALAGAQNAIQEFSDYKPLTTEALMKSNPDVILFFDKGLQSLGGVEGALKIEGIAATKAGKKRQIFAMDGALLSGFGPRIGEAALLLNQWFSEHAK